MLTTHFPISVPRARAVLFGVWTSALLLLCICGGLFIELPKGLSWTIWGFSLLWGVLIFAVSVRSLEEAINSERAQSTEIRLLNVFFSVFCLSWDLTFVFRDAIENPQGSLPSWLLWFFAVSLLIASAALLLSTLLSSFSNGPQVRFAFVQILSGLLILYACFGWLQRFIAQWPCNLSATVTTFALGPPVVLLALFVITSGIAYLSGAASKK